MQSIAEIVKDSVPEIKDGNIAIAIEPAMICKTITVEMLNAVENNY